MIIQKFCLYCMQKQKQQKVEANDILKNYKTLKPSGKRNNYKYFNALSNVSERKSVQDFHMPFKFDDSKAEKAGDTEMLLQEGFINHYSKKRKTPVFTAQRLDGKILKATVSNNSFFYS